MNERIIKRLWKDAAYCAATAALVGLVFDSQSHCCDGRPSGTGFTLWVAAHDPWFLLTLLLFCLSAGFAVTAVICQAVQGRVSCL